MLILLFSSRHELLGEFWFEQGAWSHVSLSSIGERQVASLIADWQMRGIPRRERQKSVLHGQEDMVHEEMLNLRHVSLHSSEAEPAFLTWATEQRFYALKLPERLLEQWQKLCQLSLEPEERFASIQALTTGSHAVVQAWDRAIDTLLKG
ncbi:hypothetical protein KBD34_02320 [Patescibacteria group bacterium]|nr:hypothetical protein [Patescibacteria group bacterium]